ncbi:MAG: type II 3-dehydroquinate dehydratase, partial [Gemmatimonadaceae bacterium]
RELSSELRIDLEFTQHNGEGELIETVHAMRGRVAGVVVNAGAYSHSSLALRDALVGVGIPFVEVHITNTHARERERRHSMLSSAAVGLVYGLGVRGYELALRGLAAHLTRDG